MYTEAVHRSCDQQMQFLTPLQVLHRIMSSETDYLSIQQGAKVALLVNSLGSVMPAELHIAANAAISMLQDTFKAKPPFASPSLTSHGL